MHIQEFDFTLPEALIAQTPVAGARDQSRLLVVDRKQQGISHHHFFELPHFLRRGDVLVLNNSKVFPARLFGKKKKTGGRIEVLFLRSASSAQEQWEVLIGGATVRPGTMLEFEGGLKAEILERMSDKTWRIQLNKQGKEFIAYRDQFGHTPIPPYIQHNQSKETELRKQYQTVYAQQEGSVAAPTAGLHFSEEL
ncbi:MAG TPA: S-adenosylmethionine:tRNA ribosyltransferase-isomerase, partial [Patescibacteria group bacterium]|nr:S-adenosylmethionine:tRNA ribosyltransferase-isomerase [Patescibacteria group bacterium]